MWVSESLGRLVAVEESTCFLLLKANLAKGIATFLMCSMLAALVTCFVDRHQVGHTSFPNNAPGQLSMPPDSVLSISLWKQVLLVDVGYHAFSAMPAAIIMVRSGV